MNEKYLSILYNYINDPSSYGAIFLKGPWGIGKTYFVHNELKDYLKKKKISIIYLSLSGISTNKEIKDLLISKTINHQVGINNQTFKSIVSKATGLVTKIDKLKNVLDIVSINDIKNSKTTLYCIDDLERISSKYNIQDALGFLNTQLTENKNTKTLLIGNDLKSQLSKDEFKLIEEKFIYRSIQYNSDINLAYSNIINKYKIDLPSYFNYLFENKEFITKNCNYLKLQNLRSFQFFLANLLIIKQSCDDIKNITAIIKDIIYFCMIISFEFKRASFDANLHYKVLPSYINQIKDRERERDKFKLSRKSFHKYLSNIIIVEYGYSYKYNFFPSIYELVTKGLLDEKKLKDEAIQYIAHKKKREKSSIFNLIKKLQGYLYLDNETFQVLYDKLLVEIETNKLTISEFIEAANLIFDLVDNNLTARDHTQLSFFLTTNLNQMIHHGMKNDILSDEQYKRMENAIFKLDNGYPNLCKIIKNQISEGLILKAQEEAEKELYALPKKDFNIWELRDIILRLDERELTNFFISNVKNRVFYEKITSKIYNLFELKDDHFDKYKVKAEKLADELI